MIHKDTEKTQKNTVKFVCNKCDFECCSKGDWNRHILRPKHITQSEMIHNDTSISYNCECGNRYKHNSGLWRHRKTCNFELNKMPDNIDADIYQQPTIPQIDPNILLDIIKQNQELQKQMFEFMKNAQNVNISNNNTNCNNTNTFNLNMFLNEKCKDAININEFVDNIKMQLTDLENFGIMGYVEGVSRILIKNLKDLDTYSRPIHCSDLKREVFYVKDNNQWTRETDDKPVLKNAIKQVANKNIKQIQVWKNENPDCVNSDSRKNDQYINIVMNSMSGGTSEEQQNNISQIVKNVSKAVAIDKTTEKL
jgi:hypothetical protein